MRNNEATILDTARRAAADKADVSIHKGVGFHRAIRVHSCFLDEARPVCVRIAEAIRPIVIERNGYPAVVVQGSDALVWWR